MDNNLANMCTERHIPVIGPSKTIHPDTHIDKSGLHLNKYETIVFAKLLIIVSKSFW